jgi:hypothetical protein
MDSQMTPIIPLEQAIIILAGHEFLVVRFADNGISRPKGCA